MQVTTIAKISHHEGKEVELRGWLYNKRSSKSLHFLQLRDGSGIIQCVVSKDDIGEEKFEEADDLSQETSLIIHGRVVRDRRSPIGYELHVTDFKVVGESRDYPISPKEHGVGFLLDHRHLWLRSRKQHALLRIRHEVISAIRDFFNTRDFVLLDAPIFTPNACEGTTTLFETEYFGRKAYLSQSGQLYMEAGAMAFGKVYCFGPTFRAEKSKTRRHLTEFWMVEPEVAFMELDEDMDLGEDLVCYIVERVLDKRMDELKTLERDTTKLESVKKPFPRISYDDAVERLRSKGRDFEWGGDFGAEDETVLANMFDRPFFVHRFPAAIKAFYMKRDPNRDDLTLSMDLLAPEGYGEIIGGGQREDDLDKLLDRIEEHKLPREAFEWYLDLRRYGSVPHAGFGLGIERTVCWIAGIHHLRETIPFPRTIERLSP